MSDCEHRFEKYDTTLVEKIANAGVGLRRGVPKQLIVRLECLDCGEEVPVEYTLAFIDGESL
jgi:hypothetical protein